MDEAEQDVLKENGITEEFLEEWMAKHQNDSVIKGEFDLLKKLGDMVFAKEGTIMHIPCTMPEGLNEDSYILVYRKQ
jgi:hypothetical protein